MKKLIVTADDFGLSQGINKGIAECAELKIITGVSVIPLSEYAYEITEFHKRFPDIDIGIHFDIFSSPADAELKQYSNPVKLFFRLLTDKNLIKKIDKEFRLQLDKLLTFVPAIQHADSHRHFHFIPQIFRLVNDIAEEFAINRIRYPLPKLNKKNIRFLFYRNDFYKFFSFYIFSYFNKTFSSSTDNFFGLFQSGKLDIKYLEYVMNEDFHYAELMTHPGYVDDYLKTLNENLLYSRETELKILKEFFSR